MFQRMCIRNKFITIFLIILLVDLAAVLFLEDKTERELVKTGKNYDQLLSENPLISMLIGGGLHDYFIMQKKFGSAEEQDSLRSIIQIVKGFRNQIILIFGFTLFAGFVMSVIVGRRISKPMTLFSNFIKRMWKDFPDKSPIEDTKIPNCSSLEALAESFRKMHQGLLEYEEEKSRVEGVEITKRLAAGIAHEIKNPVNTVGLILDYIQTNFSPDDSEKRYEFFKLADNMKNELRRINRTVEGFLRLTKPNVFQFEKVDINSIIRDTTSLFDPERVKQGVVFNLELAPDLPLIKADRDKMNQVFSNLIINALEAMPRGGELNITTAFSDGGDNIEVRVSDTGIGIPPEDKGKIFSPYFTTKKQGFGIGLSLIHSIIHGHQGKININTERKKGTEFVILLPIDF
ncbi:MAG: two-component system sensor histidine kinase NtrB [Spirochaetota bacterium]